RIADFLRECEIFRLNSAPGAEQERTHLPVSRFGHPSEASGTRLLLTTRQQGRVANPEGNCCSSGARNASRLFRSHSRDHRVESTNASLRLAPSHRDSQGVRKIIS